MKRTIFLALGVLLALLVIPTSASADPIKNKTTLTLQETCSNGQSYRLITAASGASLLNLNGTNVQLTRQLTVTDPFNELGGSFTIPLQKGFTYAQLVYCQGVVVGTSVSFTSYVQIVP